MKKLVIAALLMAMISSVSAQSTGAAPSFQNLGEAQPGQTLRGTIYVSGTSFEEPYAVAPQAEMPISSKVLNPDDSPIPVQEYSEEDITGWVSFDQETYTINPNNSTPYVLENGDTINANGQVSFNIRVPNDAEPGWHVGVVSLDPQTGGGSGFGALTQTVSLPMFVFNVQTGESPERRLEVVDARGLRTGTESARVDLRIANRGSVTTSLQGGNIDIYNRATNRKVHSASVGYYSLQPGQSDVIPLDFDSPNVTEGSYMVNGTLDYSSSQTFIGQQTISIASEPPENPSDPDDFSGSDTDSSSETSTPLWLLGLFVLVLSVIMYSFGFDLFWIIVGAGFIGIGLFILVSPASNWLLIILLTTPVIIIYYV